MIVNSVPSDSASTQLGLPEGQSRAVFTICSCNYLGQALSLMESLVAHEPDCARYIILVDRKSAALALPSCSVSFVWVEDLDIENFEFIAFSYDVLELNTNIKPRAMRRLLERHRACVYLDPDILVYQPLVPVWKALETASVVLTPHMLNPVFDGARPSEKDLLRFGVFNLGFIGVAATDEGRDLLHWWENRCLSHGFQAPADGLFVDQKFIDMVPGYFKSFSILRHPGLNVAYWNLHERVLRMEEGRWRVAGEDLVFFHFSGFIYRPNHNEIDKISKYVNRVSLSCRPELEPLFNDYRSALNRNGYDLYINLPYSFSTFDNGVVIPRLARRVVSSHFAHALLTSPFLAEGPVYSDLARARLIPRKRSFLSGHRTPHQAAFPVSRLWAVVVVLLRLVLLVIGVKNYELMLRFMSKVGSDLNHGFLIARRRK
jgi:hypothetical protein